MHGSYSETPKRMVTLSRLPVYGVCAGKKGKGFPHSLPSVGPEADPGL